MKKIYNKGITLIALVITIIVILVLAGLSISVFSENGILEKAINSKERAKVAELEEDLKIKLLESQASNNNIKDIDAYEKYLKENNITEIVTANEITKYITMEDKYIFKAEVKEDEYIDITYEGIIGEVKPQITDVKITKTTNSIKVEVSSILSKDATYTYYIKKQGEEKYTKVKETTENINEYTDLDDDTTYEIVIELKAKDSDELDSYEKTVTLAKVKDLVVGDISYKVEPDVWTNTDVTVTAIAETPTEDFALQTSKDGEKWTEQQNQKFTENGVMFVRLWDGRNAGSWSNGNVNNIDKTAPIVGTPLNNASKTTNSMTMNFKTIDEDSGISKIIWYYKLSTESEYKSEIEADEKAPVNGSTNGVRTEQTKNKIFSDLTSGTYNLYAEVYDVAGNVTRTPSTGTVDVTLDNVATATSGNITIESVRWNGINATVKFNTTSGHTIQTSTDNQNWTTSDTKTVASGTTIYVRLTDGINVGNSYAAITPKLGYTVVYNGNGNTGGSTASSNHIYGEAKNLTSNGFTKSGYTFAGWATSSTGNVVYSNGASVSNLCTTNGGTVTLYAKWNLSATISLSSTSGTLVYGTTNSKTITVSGNNYGILSVNSSNNTAATASVSGTTVTINIGNITAGTTASSVITVSGSNGVSATYNVTSHRHSGDSGYGGGCYTVSTSTPYTEYCGGCQQGSSYTYNCSGCVTTNPQAECMSKCTDAPGLVPFSCRQACAMLPTSSSSCPGHTGYNSYCPGHQAYRTTYSLGCEYKNGG